MAALAMFLDASYAPVSSSTVTEGGVDLCLSPRCPCTANFVLAVSVLASNVQSLYGRTCTGRICWSVLVLLECMELFTMIVLQGQYG